MANRSSILMAFLVLYTAWAATYYCDSCSDCTSKIASATAGDVIVLTQDINASGTCIDDPDPSVSGGIIIFDCNGHTLTGDGTLYGIFLTDLDSSHIRIQNCDINNFTEGITLYGNLLTDVNIVNVRITNSTRGVIVIHSDGIRMDALSMSGIVDRGIILEGDENPEDIVIEDTNIESDGDGIHIADSNGVRIADVMIFSDNIYGIEVIDSNNIVLERVDTNSSNYGVEIFRSLHILVADSSLFTRAPYRAMYINRSSDVDIYNTEVRGCLYGIEVYASEDVNVHESEIYGCTSAGIYAHDSSAKVYISDSEIRGNLTGIRFLNASDSNVIGAYIHDNTQSGVTITGENIYIVDLNSQENPNGLELIDSNHVLVLGAQIFESSNAGISLSGGHDLNILSSYLSGNSTGVDITGSVQVRVEDTNIVSGDYGITLHSGSETTLKDLYMADISSRGISVYDSNSAIQNSTIRAYTAVYLYSAAGTLSHSDLQPQSSGSGTGISVEGGYNQFAVDHVSASGFAQGLMLYKGYGVTVQDSNFKDNKEWDVRLYNPDTNADYCDNTFSNVLVSRNKPLYYFSGSSYDINGDENADFQDASLIILCGADGSSLSHVNVCGAECAGGDPNNGVIISYSSGVTISDLTSEHNWVGLQLIGSSATVDTSGAPTRLCGSAGTDLRLEDSSSISCSGCNYYFYSSSRYMSPDSSYACSCDSYCNIDLELTSASPLLPAYRKNTQYDFPVVISEKEGNYGATANVDLLVNSSVEDNNSCYVPPGSSCVVTLTWIPDTVGPVDQNFVVDRTNDIPETDETNNNLYNSAVVCEEIYSYDADGDSNEEYWVDCDGDGNVDHYLDEDDNVYTETDNQDYDGDSNSEIGTDTDGDGGYDGYYDSDTNSFNPINFKLLQAKVPAITTTDLLFVLLLALSFFFLGRNQVK